ncbi:MAG: TPM domain-containing protein [Bacteroidota bacterium]
MKNYILLFCCLFSFAVIAQDVPDAPNPPRLVNDFANMLQPNEEAALESKLVAYNDSTSTQMTIAIVETLNGNAISEYSFALGRKWGIGQKGKNNGLLIVWSPKDRKYFIATGYGLEGAIPDGLANRIGDEYLGANFKNGTYYQGLDEATTALIKQARGEYKAEPRNTDGGGQGMPVFLIIGIIVLVIFFFRRNNRGGGHRSGGGLIPIFFPFNTFGSGGSSSGSGFGGGSGGGFGGFGGGSFGGGGAGGDY